MNEVKILKKFSTTYLKDCYWVYLNDFLVDFYKTQEEALEKISAIKSSLSSSKEEEEEVYKEVF